MKILIADDHALFRDGLALRLEQIAPEAVILQASNYAQIFKFIKSDSDIAIIILDIEMQDMPWMEALQEMHKLLPKTAIVVVSASEDGRTIRSVMSTGVKGYIPKRSDIKVFDNALKLILDGGTYVPPVLINNPPINNLSTKSTGLKTLTNRQSQVLDLIAQGKSNKQIAYDMGVSESTVKLHINALLRSLHVSNRTQAVVTAQKLGII
ncbi:MAG: response regulator transcription factor [Alphaproteobacteria bacterium]|nr:response regulator transcription factor [Alphaproteobacteria bacterium]MBR1756417.1 response regulator transcription factor [Alphaproteobacteria bacterium]